MTKEQQDDINSLKELIADKSISADERQVYIDGLAELEKVETISLKDFAKQQGISITSADADEQEEKSVRKKPQTTQRAKQTTKPKKAITKKAKAVKKPTPLPSDVDAMKKAIKERTGKTEAECEDIIAQYRKLRAKAKVNNAKRTEKLKSDDKLITGTNVITPVAQIEKDAEIVKVKIEKQVEQIENKAERDVVKKDKTKDEVKVEVEQKVVKKLAKLSDEMVSSATTFVKNIQTELKKVDKTEAKNFLLGLRNEIDALLSKFGDGGSTIETYNITENESASSVNPSLFARGGGIYSSDELYILKVYDLNNNLVDSSKRIFAKNLTKAKEIAIDDYESDMHKKYGRDLRFKIELAPSMMAKGGGVRTGSDGREYPFGSAWALEHNKHNKKENYEIPTSSRKMGMGGETENDYVVNVGNIGNIACDSLLEARMMYDEYVEQSKSGMGRAGNEYVGLYKNGEPILEYFGTLDNDNEYKRGGGVGEDLENYSNYNEFYNVVFDYIKREENLTEEETKDICIVNESIIEGEFDNGSSPRFTGDVVLGYLSNERAYKRGGGVRTGSDGREYPFGSAWALEHNEYNESEKYEISKSSRKS